MEKFSPATEQRLSAWNWTRLERMYYNCIFGLVFFDIGRISVGCGDLFFFYILLRGLRIISGFNSLRCDSCLIIFFLDDRWAMGLGVMLLFRGVFIGFTRQPFPTVSYFHIFFGCYIDYCALMIFLLFVVYYCFSLFPLPIVR